MRAIRGLIKLSPEHQAVSLPIMEGIFYCDSIAADILIVKGQKCTSGRSSNTTAEDTITSNGSGIAVADVQCMIIVEQGKVMELCADPGQFTKSF